MAVGTPFMLTTLLLFGLLTLFVAIDESLGCDDKHRADDTDDTL
jgi:hypothetical protein